MNLQEALTQPNKQVIPSIRVTINRGFPGTTIANGNFKNDYMVTDGDTEAKLTIFSKSGVALTDGMTYDISSTHGARGLGGISVNQYNGKTSLQCSEQATFVADNAGGSPVSPPAAQTAPVQQTQAAASPEPSAALTAPSQGGKREVLAASWADTYIAAKSALMSRGIPEAEAIQVAAKAPECGALYWFGEKDLS